jgi:hypothetical protein
VYANAPDAHAILLGGDDDERLVLCLPTNDADFLAASKGFVHLDHAIQPIPTGAHHGAAQLMQHRPGGLVTAQAEHALRPCR